MDEKAQNALVHRSYVLTEFIESEREYVRRLQVAVEDYFLHIKSENVSPDLKNDLSTIFSTLPEIAAFHKNLFIPSLEACNWQEDPDAVMECFLTHRSEFGVYLAFCKNKPTSDGVRVEHEQYFTLRQSELGHKLSIEDLLIAPVQRLPRYQLLIKDLLKDTRKAHLDSAKIEEALELMLKIPLETNNIICMSLLRGINRGAIISHGSLWRQNTLGFSCSSASGSWDSGEQASVDTTGTCNVKNEPRQIFLFDHRILVAAPADRDGFYDYQMGLKTLNGRVSEESANSNVFSFTTEGGVTCAFKASNEAARKHWVNDIRAILDSQMQMKKALVFGKSAASSFHTVRMDSLSVEWSDSDSSVDSMPSSANEDDEQEDWPEHTGFQKVVNKSSYQNQVAKKFLTVPNKKPLAVKTKKQQTKPRSFSLAPPPLGPRHQNRQSSATDAGLNVHQLVLSRPMSCNLDSISEFDQHMQRKSHALSISPRMLRNWVARKSNSQSNTVRIYFPTSCAPGFDGIRCRSPGSKPQHNSVSHREVLFITIPDPPAVAPQLYAPLPGQVFLAEDVSQVEVWKVRALSGDIAGVSVWVQRNCLEEYSAPIRLKPWKKEYRVLKSLSVGRFSKVKQVKSKSSNEVHALKILQNGTSEDQFYRELCIGTRMKHRNLVHYFTGLQQSLTMAIAMDFINGRLLFDYLLRKASVSEKMVVDLMQQLLDGLDYMHQHTVYHLDIRPDNIMMDLARDTLKIVDYGAARHSGDVDEVLSHNFETCYNYEYVPPEIFQQVRVGPGTDVWGVGLIMYSLFFGCTPFYGESPVRIIANITGLRYSFPEDSKPPCSQLALDLIKDILVMSPSQRPEAKTARQHRWFSEPLEVPEKVLKLSQLRHFYSQHS